MCAKQQVRFASRPILFDLECGGSKFCENSQKNAKVTDRPCFALCPDAFVSAVQAARIAELEAGGSAEGGASSGVDAGELAKMKESINKQQTLLKKMAAERIGAFSL